MTLLKRIDNVGVSLENAAFKLHPGASRLPQRDGIRCILVALQMTMIDYKLAHEEKSWVNSNLFLPLEKELKEPLVPSLKQNSCWLADPEASREECFEGV